MRILFEMAGAKPESFIIGKELQQLRRELSKMRDLSDITVDLATPR